MSIDTLYPAMPQLGTPTWAGAVWVGAVGVADTFADVVTLDSGDGFASARLLVRDGLRPIGFVEIDVVDGKVAGSDLAREVGAMTVGAGGTNASSTSDATPHITVVLCTRNRVDHLRTALKSVLAVDYPHFDVVVVDNASDDSATFDYVEKHPDPRVSAVVEPTPGLAVARNCGLRAATGEIVAFTDDDVVVDAGWLRALAVAFADARVGCVSGLVPSGELRTPTQSYFEQRVQWSDSLERVVFDLAAPPEGNRLFPFRVGVYGTGANFALRRSTVFDLGGFDEGLGVGSPTGGGEDIDMFVRVVVSGARLVFEPSAIVWHRHRDDVDALIVQARGYGLGLGAWLTKVAVTRSLGPMALRRAFSAARHLRDITATTEVAGEPTPPSVRRAEIAAIAKGPFAYAKSRRAGRRAAPLVGAVSRAGAQTS